MIQLKGRTILKTVQAEKGHTILDLAMKHNIDWGFSCTQGNCARCRCFIEEGRELLGDITDAEERRLDPEEIEEGYRLGCQAEIVEEGHIKATNRTYF